MSTGATPDEMTLLEEVRTLLPVIEQAAGAVYGLAQCNASPAARMTAFQLVTQHLTTAVAHHRVRGEVETLLRTAARHSQGGIL